MASSHVGGLSGAFIPVSEDKGMIDAAACGALTIEKLEAMTSVCSVGLDMIAVGLRPFSIPAQGFPRPGDAPGQERPRQRKAGISSLKSRPGIWLSVGTGACAQSTMTQSAGTKARIGLPSTQVSM